MITTSFQNNISRPIPPLMSKEELTYGKPQINSFMQISVRIEFASRNLKYLIALPEKFALKIREKLALANV
jgi:hypothetical protein